MSVSVGFNDGHGNFMTICDNRMNTFCKTNDFKVYVRSAINDELYWREWMNKLNISNQVENIVPDCVKKNVKKILPDMVETEMKTQYPKVEKAVSKELENQIPRFLLNNYKIESIVNDHKNFLTKELDTHAKQVIHTVVDDPVHQSIANAHIKAIDERGEQAMHKFSIDSTNQLSSQSKTFMNELSKMSNQVNTTMVELKNALSDVSSLRSELAIVKRDLEKSKKNNEKEFLGIKIGAVVLAIVALFGVGTFALTQK